MTILHGGQLSRVAKQYQISEEKWLDLSTGIAPFSYPIPMIPNKVWQNLPTIGEGIIKAAQHYYQAEHCRVVAGSQQIIEKLPQLWSSKKTEQTSFQNPLPPLHAYLPKVGYKEHQHAWTKAGYQIHFYQSELPNNIEKNSVVVVINPNNPLADVFTIQQLTTLQNNCNQQQALLIIDEAFADSFDSAFSFVPVLHSEMSNVIVLRSFGKFFGLAGLRIGFVCSCQYWCEIIENDIGPWSINGPALYIAERALKDEKWQQKQRQKLNTQNKKMQVLLADYLPQARIEANALFITVFASNAPELYQQLCQQACYVRLTDENNALRFGIANESQFVRLKEILQC